MLYNNILETIGDTPLVRLNKITADLPCPVYAKVETFNPGNSIKDRMAVKMIDDAEAAGLLKPGGTIIECTSGNTGMGLALVGCVRGYKCIFTTNDKQSKEKMDILKALGAEVIICPTNVTPDDPRSYYSVAEKLSQEIPNSFWCNQYDNLSNTKAHYESTGPEIWKQTEGKVTKLVVGVGTGGTICGTGKYLKEMNPNVQTWGIDTYGSVFKKYKETGEFDEKEIYPYITEGIGEDILPANVNFDLIDRFEKVTDQDGAMMARRLAKEEGLFLGYSAGSALAGLLQMKDQLSPDDLVVVIFHDHGSRYVAKIFNDDWMRDRGFLPRDFSISDALKSLERRTLIKVDRSDKLRKAFDLMKSHDISQLVVTENGNIVGSVTENAILSSLLENPYHIDSVEIDRIMSEPFPIVADNIPLKDLKRYISKKIPAVLIRENDSYRILTQYDILRFI